MLDVPAIEHEGDMGVVGVPGSMGCTAVVGGVTHILPSGLRHEIDVAAASAAVAIDDHLAHGLRQGCRQDMLVIDSCDDMFVVEQVADDLRLDVTDGLTGFGGTGMVEKDHIVGDIEDDRRKTEACFELLFHGFDPVPHLQSAGGYMALFEQVGVVGGSVVGREEDEVVATSYLLVESLEEGGHLTVELHVDIVVFRATRAVGMADGIGRQR